MQRIIYGWACQAGDSGGRFTSEHFGGQNPVNGPIFMNMEPPASHLREISVIEPVHAALARVKLVLFQPFDLGRWFIIGFCAWLAQLGESGGFNGFNFNGNFSNQNTRPVEHFRDLYGQAREFALANLVWLIPLAMLVVVLVLALTVLLLWLSSRGKFMFLHCVALNKAEVALPWAQYRGAANRLFWFRLVLGLAGLVIFLPLVVVLAVLGIRLFLAGDFELVRVMPVVGLFLGLILVGLVLVLVQKFMMDFVVPIMYLRGGTCLAAWRELGRLLAAHSGDFVLYILFQIVLAIALAFLVILVFVLTCCLACCLAMLPYLGTVLLLPFLTFQRAYALHYLAQFGPEYDVFSPVPPPVSAAPTPG